MAKSEYRMKQVYKTYKQYLAERKPITNHLAPIAARPKNSRGDNPQMRIKLKEMHRKGIVRESEIPIHKNGMIDISKLKQIKRSIYKIQEESHGRG